MADKQTQNTATTPQTTAATKPTREFINVATAQNSRLNLGIDENIYDSRNKSKSDTKKGK